jgi:hypothetical protein
MIYAGRVTLLIVCIGIFGLACADSASARSAVDRVAEILGDLPAGSVPTGILYDRAVPLSRIEEHDGGAGSAPTDLRQWRQLYEEIRRASLTTPSWPGFPTIATRDEAISGPAEVPIVIMDFLYDRIRVDALEKGMLVARGARLQLGEGNPFVTARVFAAAPLRDHTYRGSSVRFHLEAADYLSNGPAAPLSVAIDFDDGRGFVPVSLGGAVDVRYFEKGSKSIRLRCLYADGGAREAAFPFEVRELLAPAPDDTLHVTATIPYLGGYGSGDAYVYLSGQNATLTNPVVLIEGFDPDNTMNWDELYALLNREQLVEQLRSLGFDAVVLNFTNGGDYIQRNAFLTVELIEGLRASIDPGRTMAVVGASMGGVVGRYALAYMETHALPHSVRTFVSFDSPQTGADVPLGIQYWLWFFSDLSTDAAANLASLDTPAARQMLVYHHTDPPGSEGQSDPLRAGLLADLAAAGDYPASPRKVAIVNGSGSRLDQGFSAGAQIIQWEYTSFLVDITGDCWAVPDLSGQNIFHGLIDYIFLPADETFVGVAGTRPYDNAPGGWRDTMAQLGASDPGYGDILAPYPNHSFIPTVSALALDTTDLFYDVAGDPDILAHTPFDAVYFPAGNQEHVSITPENAAWFLAEIQHGVGGVAETTGARRAAEIASIAPNPAGSSARIRFRTPAAGPARVEIFDAAGRRVAVLADRVFDAGEWNLLWDGRAGNGSGSVPGTYFVRLSGSGYSATGKIVTCGAAD